MLSYLVPLFVREVPLEMTFKKKINSVSVTQNAFSWGKKTQVKIIKPKFLLFVLDMVQWSDADALVQLPHFGQVPISSFFRSSP